MQPCAKEKKPKHKVDPSQQKNIARKIISSLKQNNLHQPNPNISQKSLIRFCEDTKSVVKNPALEQTFSMLMNFWLNKSNNENILKKKHDASIPQVNQNQINQLNQEWTEVQPEVEQEVHPEDILKHIRLVTLVFDDAFYSIKAINNDFMERRTRQKLVEKKVAARAFCYRGFGIKNFREEIKLWSKILDIKNPQKRYNPKFVCLWEKLEESLHAERQIKRQKKKVIYIGDESDEDEDKKSGAISKEVFQLETLYKTVSFAVATDTIRRMEETLEIKKYSKMAGNQIKYLKSVLLNSQKILDSTQYKNLTNLMKTIYQFEEIKVTEQQVSTLYMNFVDILRNRIGGKLKIDQTQEKKRIQKIKATDEIKKPVLACKKQDSEYTSQHNVKNQIDEEIQLQKKQYLSITQEIQFQFLKAYSQTQVFSQLQWNLQRKYGSFKHKFGVKPRHMLQKMGRKALNKIKILSEHYGSRVPKLIRTKDAKTRALILSPSATAVRLKMFKVYMDRTVILSEVAETIMAINEYKASMPDNFYNCIIKTPQKKRRRRDAQEDFDFENSDDERRYRERFQSGEEDNKQ